RRATPVILAVDRIHEESPTVLQVRRHHHADDAEYELAPARPFARVRDCRHIVSCGHASHTSCLVSKRIVTVLRFTTYAAPQNLHCSPLDTPTSVVPVQQSGPDVRPPGAVPAS